ncbi:hypothetical protein RQP46_006784 [Phenoliferia psychrophenolica]
MSFSEKKDLATTSVADVAEVDEEVTVGLRTWLAVFSGMSRSIPDNASLFLILAPHAGCMCIFTGFYLGIAAGSFTPYVVADVGGATSIVWLPNAFEVVVLSFAGVISSICDVYGRRYVLLGGLLIAFIGCIVIAVAESIGVVIVGSVLLSGLFVNQGNFFTIPAEVLPKRFRGVGATLTASAGGLGSVVALMVNGAFIRDHGRRGWRYGYYVGAGFMALTALSIYFFYVPIRKPTKSFRYVLTHEVDIIGTVLLTGFAVPFLIGLNWGGSAYPWASVHCIATLSIGGAFLIALIVHQVWFKKDGIFHHDLFACRNYAIATFGLFVEGVVFLVFLLFYPLMTQILYEKRPFNQVLRLLPFWGTFMVVAPVAGWYSRYTRDVKNPLIIGWALILVATIIFSTLSPDQGKIAIVAVFIAGVGFATPLALLNAAAQLAIPKHLLGLGTGQIIAARAFGTTIGATIFVAIFTAKVTVLLPAEIAAVALKAGLPATSLPEVMGGIATANATLVGMAPGLTPAIAGAATKAAIQACKYACIPFVAIALIGSIALDGPAIKKQMSWAVDRPVEHMHHVQESETSTVEA